MPWSHRIPRRLAKESPVWVAARAKESPVWVAARATACRQAGALNAHRVGARFRVLSRHDSSEQEKGPLLHKAGIRRVYAGAPDFGYACVLRFTAAFPLLRRWNVVDHPDTQRSLE
jgi:hypothetical protein